MCIYMCLKLFYIYLSIYLEQEICFVFHIASSFIRGSLFWSGMVLTPKHHYLLPMSRLSKNLFIQSDITSLKINN